MNYGRGRGDDRSIGTCRSWHSAGTEVCLGCLKKRRKGYGRTGWGIGVYILFYLTRRLLRFVQMKEAAGEC